MTPAGNAAHYRLDAESYDYVPDPRTEIGQSELRRAQTLFRLAGLYDPAPPAAAGTRLVADLGMGGGQLVDLVRRAGYPVLGCDIAASNCARAARARGLQSAPPGNVMLSAADLYRLPLASGSLRTVFVSEVLEHLEEPDVALREVSRVMAPGAVLVTSCPWRERLAYHLCIHCNRLTPANAHLHTVDEAIMTGWLKAAGLRVQGFAYFNHRVCPPLALSRRTRLLPYPVWRACERALLAVWRRPAHFAALAVKP